MIISPTPAQRSSLADRVRASAQFASLDAPKSFLSTFKKAEKNASFQRGAVPNWLATATSCLLIYGHFEKAYGMAIALGEIDRDTWDVDYNYVRRIIHQTAYVAHRQDLLTEAANLEPLLRVPSTYEPQPLLMTGKALRLPFEKMDVWSS